MVFSSLVFLCVFLPIVFVLHTLIPSLKVRNALLIIASLVFYAYGEPIFVLLMLFSSAVNYLSALLIAHIKKSKIVLIINIIFNLGMLVLFKYTPFIISTINSVFSSKIPVPEITLPIGISFFTFQALSYVIDVYKKKVEVQKNYFNVLLYISFFPQLIAGPIVKYKDISAEIVNRSVTIDGVGEGLRRFIFGLGKKVIIANTMALVADNIFSAPQNEINIITAWLGALAYMFQIYYDFSGYSDMAIGLGKMFGFHFKENFLYPYGADSVQDFWRRWHISLSSWFKEYLYIPLGGNRKGKVRTAINRIIVFFFTGLWHGANWTFIIWGLYHGLFLLFEEYVPKIKKMPKMIRHIYTLLVVCIGFVIFRADTVSQGFFMISRMFAGYGASSSAMSLAIEQLTPWFIFVFVMAVILCAPLKSVTIKIRNNFDDCTKISQRTAGVVQIVTYVIAFALLGWCMLRLSGNSYNPFIYFRF